MEKPSSSLLLLSSEKEEPKTNNATLVKEMNGDHLTKYPTLYVISDAKKGDNRTPVAILGGTGLVGRALAAHLLNHPTLRLGVLVGSPATAGEALGKVWRQKENELVKHYGSDIWQPMNLPLELENYPIVSFDDLVNMKLNADDLLPQQREVLNSLFIMSAIAPKLGHMEDKLYELGYDIFSISPHGRLRPNVPLVVPEVNGDEIRIAMKPKIERLLDGKVVGRMVKSPNCVTCGLSIVLAAVEKNFGLSEVSATTFQTLTGRGDDKYDKELVIGNVLPLNRTMEDTNRKISGEIKRIVGTDFKFSVTAQRIFAQRGHFVDVRIKTKHRVSSVEEVAIALRSFTPFANTIFEQLPDAPKHPICVILDPTWPRPVQCVATTTDPERLAQSEKGMTIFVGQICTGPNSDEELFDITLSLVVDNVARGAYGAALLTAEYFYALENQLRMNSKSV